MQKTNNLKHKVGNLKVAASAFRLERKIPRMLSHIGGRLTERDSPGVELAVTNQYEQGQYPRLIKFGTPQVTESKVFFAYRNAVRLLDEV